jgi:hypothetical protein
MNRNWQSRRWLLIAAVAIVAAIVLLVIPHGHSGNGAAWLAILPLLFVGVISPLSLLSPLACIYLGRTPEAPALPFSFQRRPPFALG